MIMILQGRERKKNTQQSVSICMLPCIGKRESKREESQEGGRQVVERHGTFHPIP